MGKLLKTLRSLFKDQLSIPKVFDSVSQGIDNLGLTQQEKADSVREFVKETLSENTERSRARRDIAKMVMFVYLGVFLLAVVAVFFSSDATKLIIDVAQAFNIGYAFLAIIAFYFGGYYLGKAQKSNAEGKK